LGKEREIKNEREREIVEMPKLPWNKTFQTREKEREIVLVEH
jgi:hypothetical protein